MFTEIFVKVLQEKGITAYYVAKQAGIAQGQMNSYKNGKQVPTAENLLKIADVLKCSVDFLLGRIGTEENEIKLISYFRKLNDEGKEDVLDYAHHATTKSKYQKYTDIDVPKEA